MADESKKTDSEVLVPLERKVTIAGEKFVVKPFTVKDVIYFTRELFDALKSIKEKYPAMEFKPEETLLYMPTVMAEAPRLVGLLARSIGKEAEWLENTSDLVGVSKLFAIVAEINDFGAIISNFRAGWSKLKSQTLTQEK